MKAQTWWNINAAKQYNTFSGWVGDSKAQSKEYMANYLKLHKYSSLVDLGCGNATFYDTLKNHNITINYQGVDSCTHFIQLNCARNIPMIESDIRSISSLNNDSIDIAFSRHTMEHQSSYIELLNEMIRICKYEACHIFFIKPAEKEEIKYSDGLDLYHNKYAKSMIEKTLAEHPKVKEWKWIDINQSENALHIYMK